MFRAVSWLGDGWLWYGLILGLPWLYRRDGVLPAVHMAVTGAVAVVIYRYSFPSGHTPHAVSFTLLMTHYSPQWFGLLAAFTVLIALSRVMLGLHYPSAVAAGGCWEG